MALPTGTTITWYGHSCVRLDTAGGRAVIIDPWFANPTSPIAVDAVDRCDLLLVTHGHFDHFGDALALASRLRPAWPCMHEMSLWLARRLPGGAEAVVGYQQGRHRGGGRPQGDDGHARTTRPATGTRAAKRPCTWAIRAGSSSSSRTAIASTTRATPRCSATCA